MSAAYRVHVFFVDGTCDPKTAADFATLQTDERVGTVYTFDGPHAHCPRAVLFPVTQTKRKDVEQSGEKFTYVTPQNQQALQTLVYVNTLRKIVQGIRGAAAPNEFDDQILGVIKKERDARSHIGDIFNADNLEPDVDEVSLQDTILHHFTQKLPNTDAHLLNARARTLQALYENVRPVDRRTCSPLLAVEQRGASHFALTTYYPFPREYRLLPGLALELASATGLRALVMLLPARTGPPPQVDAGATAADVRSDDDGDATPDKLSI